MVWVLLALLAAFFTSMTTILSKIGLKGVNSNFATFYRTGIVIICSVVVCMVSGSIHMFSSLNFKNVIFLIISGICTGCSWLCYYKALKMASANKVAPIDKSSFILTTILFVIFYFDVTTKNGNLLTILMLILSMALMGGGTMLMISKNKDEEVTSKKWLIYALLSSVFASFVALFIKMGLNGIPSDLGTLLRTLVVFVFAGAIVLVRKDYKEVKGISFKQILILTLSGIATGGAWLCEYEALNFVNANPVVVNSIGKLSILLTMFLSFVILKEKFSKKSLLGLFILTLGIVVIIIFGL